MSTSASFREAVVAAVQSLRGSKLRSFLTLLGIILATTTLIAVMSVISGMNAYIADKVSEMGADGYFVQREPMAEFDTKKLLEALRRNPQLSREEFEFLRSRVQITTEMGMTTGRGVSVHAAKTTIQSVDLQGASPNLGVINNFEATDGRFLSDSENDHRLEVAVIGKDIKDQLFPNSSPVGRSLAVQGIPFTIVGVSKAKGSVFGQSQDKFVIVPIETYFKIWGRHDGIGYAGQAVDHAHLAEAQEETRMLLRVYRHLAPKADDTFAILTSGSLLDFWNQLTGAIAATAVAVVSVFLVVGGVVIMNIMLAVVTERTREIGIRKAVGARRRDILNQFLVESSLLAALGGLIGVTLAWGLAVLVRSVTPVPMSVPFTAVVVAVTLSAVVGLFFGIYPAQRAAKLDPIEALRAEI
jgi:putative ABC transport system permease protein